MYSAVVPVLPHVDVEPVRFVEVLRRSGAARRVERDQVGPAVPFAQPARHGFHDRAVGIALDRPITAEDPDHAGVPVALAEPLTVRRGIGRCEDFRAEAPLLVPLVAPCGQQPDVKAEHVCLRHDPVDVSEVGIVGLRGIIVPEGQFAICVRHVQPVHLGERHRLDDGETLLGSLPEIAFGVLTAGAVEQLPCGVPKPEERRACCGHEKPAVLGHSQVRQFVGGPGACGEANAHGNNQEHEEACARDGVGHAAWCHVGRKARCPR